MVAGVDGGVLEAVAFGAEHDRKLVSCRKVRIAQLDEMSYRRLLWTHRPLTDFWRVGRGYQKKLEQNGLYTMGDIARCSIGKPGDYHNEDLLYKLFGINAELLIDHAWGWEPCTMREIKSFVPESSSIGAGQVLMGPYTFEKTRIVVKEMAEALALDLVRKNRLTDQIVLHVGYDKSNLPENGGSYQGAVEDGRWGVRVPKPAHGTANLKRPTASTEKIREAAVSLFERIVDPGLLTRRVYLTATHILENNVKSGDTVYEQMDLFTDYAAREKEEKALEKEHQMQEAMLKIKDKFGKNAILKGVNFLEGATGRERNRQVGGHKE
jgi:DNA polymerase V